MTSKVAERLKSLGLTISAAPTPVANYLPYQKVDTALNTSHYHLCGHLPKREGNFLFTGKVGKDVSVEDAQKCAELIVLNMLATLSSAIPGGNLDKIKKVVKINVFVSSTPDFIHQPQVANGASDALVKFLGEEVGKHARSAIGCVVLPLDVPVEIDGIFEVES